MALFESYERRIDKINSVLNSYGIASIEEAEKIVVNQPGHKDGGKQTAQNTDAERDRKTFDGTGTHIHQNKAGDQGGDVGVNHRSQRPVITGFNRIKQRFAAFQFFPDTLKNQHVGIDRHTDGQHDTGNTRQSQRGTECRHRPQDQHHVQGKSQH